MKIKDLKEPKCSLIFALYVLHNQTFALFVLCLVGQRLMLVVLANILLAWDKTYKVSCKPLAVIFIFSVVVLEDFALVRFTNFIELINTL